MASNTQRTPYLFTDKAEGKWFRITLEVGINDVDKAKNSKPGTPIVEAAYGKKGGGIEGVLNKDAKIVNFEEIHWWDSQ